MNITWAVLEADESQGNLLVQYSCGNNSIRLNVNVSNSSSVENTIELSAPTTYFYNLSNPNTLNLSSYVGSSKTFSTNYTVRTIVAANTTANGSAPNVIN